MKENGRRQPEGLPRPRSHDWIAAHFDEYVVDSRSAEPKQAATQCMVCSNIYLADSNYCRKCGTVRPGTSPQHSPSHFDPKELPKLHVLNEELDRTVDGDPYLIPEL